MRNKKNAYKILVGKPERQRPLRKPRCWWERNLQIDLKEIGWWEGRELDSSDSGYYQVAGCCAHGNELRIT